MVGLLVGAAALLSAADAYISYRRIARFGFRVELNPIIAQLAEDYGPRAAAGGLAIYNAVLLVGVVVWGNRDVLDILVGAKLALAALQRKSLNLGSLVERYFEVKRHVEPNTPDQRKPDGVEGGRQDPKGQV